MRDKIKKFFVHKLNGYFPEWAIIQARQDIAGKFDHYMTVDLMGEHSVGNQLILDYNKEKATYGGIIEATLNVQAFGTGAIECLAQLWLLLERAGDVDECFDENIAVLGSGDVQNLTGLLDNRSWQERASLDLTVSFSRTVEYKVPFFDSFSSEAIGRIGAKNIYCIGSNVIYSENDYKMVKKAYDVYTKTYEVSEQTIGITITPKTEKTIETIVDASTPIISGNVPYVGKYIATFTVGGQSDTIDIENSIKEIEFSIELET